MLAKIRGKGVAIVFKIEGMKKGEGLLLSFISFPGVPTVKQACSIMVV
jgi:hypothetical protein